MRVWNKLGASHSIVFQQEYDPCLVPLIKRTALCGCRYKLTTICIILILLLDGEQPSAKETTTRSQIPRFQRLQGNDPDHQVPPRVGLPLSIVRTKHN